MTLEQLYTHLGRLLAAGVNPDYPTTAIVDGIPHELHAVHLLEGEYYYDPSPKLAAWTKTDGTVIALRPIFEDVSELLNDGKLKEHPLPEV